MYKSYLKVIIITVAFICWRLNVEKVPKVDFHKISIICTNSPKALYPWGIIPWEAWREELFGHWIAIGKVLAEFLLQERVHGPPNSPRKTRWSAQYEQ